MKTRRLTAFTLAVLTGLALVVSTGSPYFAKQFQTIKPSQGSFPLRSTPSPTVAECINVCPPVQTSSSGATRIKTSHQNVEQILTPPAALHIGSRTAFLVSFLIPLFMLGYIYRTRSRQILHSQWRY